MGMLVVLVAMLMAKIVYSFGLPSTTQYIIWAAIEEILKLVVLISVGLMAVSNDEPIDSMIYCVTIALGFAAMENTLFIMDPFSKGNIAAGLIHGNLRFLGATLVHVVSTASIGFLYGMVFYKNKIIKTVAIISGLVAGIAIHSSFNISVINGNSYDALKAFSWIWAGAVILIILFESVKSVRHKLI
jgi:RsiW-degrading membrane proteinase PrsW (M82 family)